MFSLKLIMSYFIVFMMLGSVLGFVLSERMSSPDRIRYNNYRIEVAQNRFIVDYNRQKLEFLFPPTDLEFFIVPDGLIESFLQVNYFTLSYDPNMQDNGELGYLRHVLFEYSYLVNTLMGFGVTEESIIFDGFNVITCEDSTPESPVLIFKDGEDNIEFDDETGCAIVSSSNAMHRVQFAEKLLYHILGIMEL